MDKYKGNYRNVHAWLHNHYGSATIYGCTFDKRHNRKISWANIDGIYEKDIEHFIPLCSMCHSDLDRKNMIRVYKKYPTNRKKKKDYSNKNPLQYYKI